MELRIGDKVIKEYRGDTQQHKLGTIHLLYDRNEDEVYTSIGNEDSYSNEVLYSGKNFYKDHQLFFNANTVTNRDGDYQESGFSINKIVIYTLK